MKMSVRPGKRDGDAKLLYNEAISAKHIDVDGTGKIALTITASDVYTAKATQRYTLVFSQDELGLIHRVAKNSV